MLCWLAWDKHKTQQDDTSYRFPLNKKKFNQRSMSTEVIVTTVNQPDVTRHKSRFISIKLVVSNQSCRWHHLHNEQNRRANKQYKTTINLSNWRKLASSQSVCVTSVQLTSDLQQGQDIKTKRQWQCMVSHCSLVRVWVSSETEDRQYMCVCEKDDHSNLARLATITSLSQLWGETWCK